MKQGEMLAMILAGGRGSRLKDLTNKVAKPAVDFGGKYRIIDFPLSNCANSGIKVVGVLTQYESVLLNSYVAGGAKWGLDTRDSGVFVLPPREKADQDLDVYRGTADAISQNIDFIDSYDPEYILVLSGDHIYKMNYDKMLDFHKANKADATIAVIPVPMKEASRFGIMNTNTETHQITEFEEKPAEPKSNLASMGIYIFTWKLLRKILRQYVYIKPCSDDNVMNPLHFRVHFSQRSVQLFTVVENIIRPFNTHIDTEFSYCTRESNCCHQRTFRRLLRKKCGTQKH